MNKRYFSSSIGKIIIGGSCILVIVTTIFIFNKIRTVPERIVLVPPQLNWQVAQELASLPEERASLLTKESTTTVEATLLPIKVQEEYPKQVIVALKSWSDI